ncbi:MAG: 4-amino-4-deoxy-L-arabinose transferase-like glycosyltransferase [Mariniblastus sp.]|jgi:4-amino-4-deoxy-L-arabinose transferase-like glycosyltransferase
MTIAQSESLQNVSFVFMSASWQSMELELAGARSVSGSTSLVEESVSQQSRQTKSVCRAQLRDAIAKAEHRLIAIVDEGTTVDQDQLRSMLNRVEQAPVQTCFEQSIPLPSMRFGRIKRVLIQVLTWLTRLVFRIQKTEFTRGVTLIDRDQISAAINELECTTSSSRSVIGSGEFGWAYTVEQLLAMCRLQGICVVETKTAGHVVFSATAETAEASKEFRFKRIQQAFQATLRFWWNRIMFPRRNCDAPDKRYRRLDRVAALLVLGVLGGFILFQNLGFPLFEPDEARNSQLASNVLESGHWLSLTLASENYWDKPPLQIWAIACSYKIFGVSPFSTRVPIALAAALTVLLTVLVGQRLVGFRAAWLAGILLLLTTGFVCTGRYVTMDASLTAMATAMSLFGFLAIQQPFQRRFSIAAGVACGLGILIKGPVIGVLCLPPLLVAIWLGESKQSWSLKSFAWFAVPAFLISAPWFIATAVIHPDFLVYFFWKHHVVRFSAAFNHREPFWYYFIGIFIFMFPASYLLPSVAKFLTSRKSHNRFARTREHGYLLLSALWVVGFFSISESKLPTYILPSFPPICLLMGVLLDRKLFSNSTYSIAAIQASGRLAKLANNRTWLEKIGRRAPIELLFWFGITGLAANQLLQSESVTATYLLVCTCVLLMLVVATSLFRAQPKIAWACFGAMACLMISLTAHQLIPGISSDRSIHVAAARIQTLDEFQHAPVVFFGRESYGAGMTLNSSEIKCFDETDVSSLVEFLASNPHSIIVASEEPMDVLRHDLPWTIALEERDDARHLYVSRPNAVLISHQMGDRVVK